MRYNARTTLPALLLAPLFVLAACSNDSSTSSTESTAASPAESAEHNQADVDFATMMIPHHQQALEMAEMATSTSDNAQIVALAETIKAAQQPEIDTMAGWLEDWNQPVPDSASSMEDMEGMDHGDTGGGMMSEDQMGELGNAAGADFDAMFLEMMIEHHQGAIDAAETEVSQGEYLAAIEMAQAIVDAQTQEIEQMQDLLANV